MIRYIPIFVSILMLAGCGGGITADRALDYDGYIESGWQQYNQRKYDESYQTFISARRMDDTRPEAYIGSGWSLLRRQHPDSAAVVFRTAFDYVATLTDSVDTIAGLSGSYLAMNENARVIDLFKQKPVSDLENGFPLRKHDFFLDSDDLEIVQAMALYRMGLYSSAESDDPDNALYHVNQVALAPYEYTTAQELLAKIMELDNK